MWIGGQVLVGGVWIGGVWIWSVWIGLRNSLTVGQIGTKKWKGNSSWVGSGLRNGKETHCGSAFGTHRTMGGAVMSALWGVRCCEEYVWELVLLWGVRYCERAQTVLCKEWKWFEVKIWTEMILRVFWVILRSKGKSISVDWIYWFNQTLKFYGKAFPEVIWSQNKHSLRRLEIEVSTPCEDKNMNFFFSRHCELVNSS